jgi:hypothetical protein
VSALKEIVEISLTDLEKFASALSSLLEAPISMQLAVAAFGLTPVRLLECLTKDSPDSDVINSAQAHVHLAGEVEGGSWLALCLDALKPSFSASEKHADQLLKFTYVPDQFLSEQTSIELICQSLRSSTLPDWISTRYAQRVANMGTAVVRAELAVDENTTSTAIQILAGDTNDAIRESARKRSSCHESIAKLIDDHRAAAAFGENQIELQLMSESCWPWVRYSLTSNEQTSVSILEQLSQDRNKLVRLGVALHPAASAEALTRLSGNIDEQIIRCVIKHPNTPDSVLMNLAPRFRMQFRSRAHRTKEVWKAINPISQDYGTFLYFEDLPPEALEKILQSGVDTPYRLRHFIAEHPNTSLPTLEKIAADTPDSESTLLTIACHPNANEELRSSIWNRLLSPDRPEREAADTRAEIARKSAVPTEILEQVGASVDPVLMTLNDVASSVSGLSKTFLEQLQNFLREKPTLKQLHQALSEETSRAPILESWSKLTSQLSAEQLAQWQPMCRRGSLVATAGGGYNSRDRWAQGDANAESLLGFLYSASMFQSEASIDRSLGLKLMANPSAPSGLRQRIREYLEKLPPSYGEDRSVDADEESIALAANTALPDAERAGHIKNVLNSPRKENHSYSVTSINALPAESVASVITQASDRDPKRTLDVMFTKAHTYSDEAFEVLVNHLQSSKSPLPTTAASWRLPENRLRKIAALLNSGNSMVNMPLLDALLNVSQLSFTDFRRLMLLKAETHEQSEALQVLTGEGKKIASAKQSKAVTSPKPANAGETLAELAGSGETDKVTQLTACANSSNPFIRFCSLMHELIPQNELEIAAKSLLWSDRLAACLNNNLQANSLEELVLDGNRYVRAAARHHKNASVHSYSKDVPIPKTRQFYYFQTVAPGADLLSQAKLKVAQSFIPDSDELLSPKSNSGAAPLEHERQPVQITDGDMPISKDGTVKWPQAFYKLTPYLREVEPSIPEFLRRTLQEERIQSIDDIFMPVRNVRALGECQTVSFPNGPNTPDYMEELEDFGRYYWADFDAAVPDGKVIPMRTIYNEGDADANTGMWGAVWLRETGKKIVDITSTGDCETTLTATSRAIAELFEAHDFVVLPDLDEPNYESNTIGSLVYANGLKLEGIVGLALAIAFNSKKTKV